MTVDARSWRGIAAETADELSAPIEALLRKRSRRLLGDLLRPHRRAVALTAGAIIVASLASLAGPWLIGVAIDNGIPPLAKNGDPVPLLRIAAVFAATVLVQAAATRMFVTLTGRFGQAVVLELRRRLFEHVLRLPVSFHESYTSGRVISRQTSDVDAISDLFDEGLDGLITAVLSSGDLDVPLPPTKITKQPYSLRRNASRHLTEIQRAVHRSLRANSDESSVTGLPSPKVSGETGDRAGRMP